MTGIPWTAIDSCIGNHSFEYSRTQEAQNSFEQTTGLKWDSLKDLPNASVICPNCKQHFDSPWTTCGENTFWEKHGGEFGSGFADKMFNVPCPRCKITITHEKLRASKFRKNMQELLMEDIPMPGTILSVNGKDACVVLYAQLIPFFQVPLSLPLLTMYDFPTVSSKPA